MSNSKILKKISYDQLKFKPNKIHISISKLENLFSVKPTFSNIFNFLTKLASLIFVNKKNNIDHLWVLEMKLGKYIITNYVNNYNFKQLINEKYIILCLYNNKFVLIFVKYINKWLNNFIWIKILTKKKIIRIIFNLIGYNILPFFFILKNFEKIKISKFILSLKQIMNTMEYRKVRQNKILTKNIKQAFFHNKKEFSIKFRSKKISSNYISNLIYVKYVDNHFYNLLFKKKKILYEFKKTNFLSFLDFKNLLIKR
jgi:hypothetical protein